MHKWLPNLVAKFWLPNLGLYLTVTVYIMYGVLQWVKSKDWPSECYESYDCAHSAWSFHLSELYMSISRLKQLANLAYLSHPLTHTLRPRKNRCYFTDDIFNFKCIFFIFLIENVWIPIKISLKIVPKGPIINIPTLDQIMAWRCPGDKPLSEPKVT